jgi:hypothetical protein
MAAPLPAFVQFSFDGLRASVRRSFSTATLRHRTQGPKPT